VRDERGLQARNVAVWIIWESGSKSLREIGELFSGLDYAAAVQRIRRTREDDLERPRAGRTILLFFHRVVLVESILLSFLPSITMLRNLYVILVVTKGSRLRDGYAHCD